MTIHDARLKAVSYLAPNMFGFYDAICRELTRVSGVQIDLTQAQADPLDDLALLEDRVDLAFICGLPLMRHHTEQPTQFDILAAPIFEASRYGGAPVYFADVVVRVGSPFSSLDALQGSVFCYNDLGSNSGYHLLRDHLKQRDFNSGFFRTAICSGSHQRSIQIVASGQADAAAIDSTVLDQARRASPDLVSQLRIVASVGPCPVPPIVIARRLDSALVETFRASLLHPGATFHDELRCAGVSGFAARSMADYAAIGERYHAAAAFELVANADSETPLDAWSSVKSL